jgi:serine/threonine protein kinase
MVFAKYVEDRPLLSYAMEFLKTPQKDEKLSTMINQYIQELRERPEARGWCLWRRGGRGGRMEDTKRFLTDFEFLRRVKHRHIVEYIGSFNDSQTFCTIMSPSADVNLGTYMESKSGQGLTPRDQSLIRSFFGCLVIALEYLHYQCQIRHKSITPSNILLHGSNVLLTDFAASLDWSETGGTTTLNETPLDETVMDLRYTAPEVARYLPVTSSSDIWSLGCVFLEMLAFLNSYTTEQLRTHFESHGTYSRSYYENTSAVNDLLLKFESTTQSEDHRAISWIRYMLRVQPHERPYARELATRIRESVVNSSLSFRFCGACCLSDSD